MTEKLLTVTEVADIFRVSPRTVKNWSDAGKLPVVLTPGGQRRFRTDAVEAFLKGASVE